MKKLGWALVWMTGCGGPSYCEKTSEWFACGEAVEIDEDELADCEAGMKACSSQDQKNLIEGTECLLETGVLGFCESTTESSTGTPSEAEVEELAAAVADCEARFLALSAECTAEVFGTPQ